MAKHRFIQSSFPAPKRKFKAFIWNAVIIHYVLHLHARVFVNEEGSLQSSTTKKKTAALFEFKNQGREAKTKFVVIIASRNIYPSLSVNLSFQQQNMLPSKRGGASSSTVVREEL